MLRIVVGLPFRPRWSPHIIRACQSTLAGTASEKQQHIVFHTSLPEAEWPARFERSSELLQALAAPENVSLTQNYLASFAYSPTEDSHAAGVHSAFVYPSMTALPFPVSDSKASADQIASYLSSSSPVQASTTFADKTHVYVCTHGTRDCRCGIIGSSVLARLQKEIYSRQMQDTISVFPISHIGGHKFAGNVLVYPQGDWYGSIQDDDVPNLVQTIVNTRSNTITSPSFRDVWFARWRGRLGLSKEEQIAAYEQRLVSADLSLAEILKNKRKERKRLLRAQEIGDALTIKVGDRAGEEVTLQGFEGETLKDVLKRKDLVEATCGGFVECATCHSYLDPAYPTPISDSEEDQLEFTPSRQDNSRLACAIILDQQFKDWQAAGGRIQVAT